MSNGGSLAVTVFSRASDGLSSMNELVVDALQAAYPASRGKYSILIIGMRHGDHCRTEPNAGRCSAGTSQVQHEPTRAIRVGTGSGDRSRCTDHALASRVILHDAVTPNAS